MSRNKLIYGLFFLFTFIIVLFFAFTNTDEPKFNIGPSQITLQEGDVFDLQTTLSEDLKDEPISLVVSNTSLISLDGLTLKALKEGTAQIEASIQGSDTVVIITVNVLEKEVFEEVFYRFEFNTSELESLNLLEGEIFELPVLDIEGYLFEGWLSDDETIIGESITVTEDLTLTPILNKLIESIVLEIDEAILFPGETMDLQATMAPSDYDVLDLNYEVSDEEIVTIDEQGMITALKAGAVTVTAIDTFSGISETLMIVVEDVEVTRYVTVQFDTDGGSLVEAVQLEVGNRLNLKEEPEKEGFIFKHWVLERNYTGDKIIENDDFIYRDMSLKAVWGLNTYTIKTLNGDITKELAESENPQFTYELLNEDGSFFAYGITSPAELQALAMNLSYSAVLLNDIVFPNTGIMLSVESSDLLEVMDEIYEQGFHDSSRFDLFNTNFLPIGSSMNPYKGSLFGNEFSISNVLITFGPNMESENNYYEERSDVGLIGYLRNDTDTPVEISYLTMINSHVDASLTDDGENHGILVGRADGAYGLFGHIVISEDSTLKGYADTGSVFGDLDMNFVTMSSITNHASVTGGTDVGGLIGFNNASDGSFDNLINRGTVYGSGDVGGLFGEIDEDRNTFTNLLNVGNVSASGADVGGIVGKMDSYENSFENLINRGTVYGSGDVGGLFGEIDEDRNTFTNLLNVGNVSASGADVGGIIGYMDGSNNVFTTLVNNGIITSRGDLGGVIGQIQTSNNTFSALTNNGTIVGITSDTGGVIGYINANNNAFFDLLNTGTVSGRNDVGGVIGQINDDDLTFSQLTNQGSVFASENVNDDGYEGNNIGGIIGNISSGEDNLAFEYLYNFGKVTGIYNVGGIVGDVVDTDNTVFEFLYNYGDITGDYEIGGIFGDLEGEFIEVKNVQNRGNIQSTNQRVGGIVGYLDVFQLLLIDAINYGNISTSGDDIGGIIGVSSESSSNTNTFENLTNYGNISSSGRNIGGLFGDIQDSNFNIYENLTNFGEITGSDDVGGIFGDLSGNNISGSSLTNFGLVSIINNGENGGGIVGDLESGFNQYFENLTNYGSISGRRDIGGLFGDVAHSSVHFKYLMIKDSENYGSVNGTTQIGGIIGGNYDSGTTLNNVTNFGSVTALETRAGGIIGYLNGFLHQLENVEFFGMITGNSYIGGLVGYAENSDLNISGAVITSSIESSNSGLSFIGGGLGYLNGYISSSGVTISTNIIAVSASGVGGYIGVMDGFGGTFDNSSIEGTINAFENVGGLIGKFERVSGSFIDVTIKDHDISIDIDADGLNVGGYIGAYMDDEGTLNIISSNFSGTLMASGDVGGFVGTLESNVNVSGLVMSGEASSGEMPLGYGNNVGGLFGYAAGNIHRIESVTFSGIVAGNSYIGGLVGYFIPNSALVNSADLSGVVGATNFSIGGAFGILSGGAIQVASLNNSGSLLRIDSTFTVHTGGLIGTTTVSEVLTLSGITINVTNVLEGVNHGGLLGYASGNIAIENSVNYMVISGSASGGFIGELSEGDLRIVNATNAAAVSGIENIGGLAGVIRSSNVYIVGFINDGYIYGTDNIGGLIGSLINTDEVVEMFGNLNSNTVVAHGPSSNTGGLFGYASGRLLLGYSINQGLVTGKENVGGFIGHLSGASIETEFLYNYGEIKGETSVGGFAGKINQTENLFRFISNEGDIYGDHEKIGGLIGSFNSDAYTLNIISVSNTRDVIYTGETPDLDISGGAIGTSGSAIGGLVGSVRADQLEVTSSSVNAYIHGFYGVGGLIGSIELDGGIGRTGDVLSLQLNTIAGTVSAATIDGRGALVGEIILLNGSENVNSNDTDELTLIPPIELILAPPA